jgi:hypothetical protein
LRLYQGATEAVSMHTRALLGDMKALLRLYEGPIKALLRLY